MPRECEGCNTAVNGSQCMLSIIPHLSSTQQCPCLTCIVKPICIVTCDRFEEYVRLSKARSYPTLIGMIPDSYFKLKVIRCKNGRV